MLKSGGQHAGWDDGQNHAHRVSVYAETGIAQSEQPKDLRRAFLEERLGLNHHQLSIRGIGEAVHWSREGFQVFILLQCEKTRYS